jgi:hypothetical protein
MGAPMTYRQCPSTQYQPLRCCAQWPGTHAVRCAGGSAHRPGTQA